SRNAAGERARRVRIGRTRAASSSRREWSFLGSLAAGIGSVLGYGRRAGAGFWSRHGAAKLLEEILTRARAWEQAGRYSVSRDAEALRSGARNADVSASQIQRPPGRRRDALRSAKPP